MFGYWLFYDPSHLNHVNCVCTCHGFAKNALFSSGHETHFEGLLPAAKCDLEVMDSHARLVGGCQNEASTRRLSAFPVIAH